MPKVITSNNHRFRGPNTYHSFIYPYNTTGQYPDLWVSPSPGILVTALPNYNSIAGSTGTGYRYNILTDTYSTENYAFGTYPNLEGASTINKRSFGYCSLGGGYALFVVYDDSYGGSTGYLYNDSTRSWSVISAPGSGSGPPSIGLYQLGLGLAFLELGGTTAYVYNRTGGGWGSAITMPRNAWAGAYITDGLLYLAGRTRLSTGISSFVDYPAESFLYNHSTSSFTNLGHIMAMASQYTFNSNLNRCGLMTRLSGYGVIGVGDDNTWAIYNHGSGTIFSRPRTQTGFNQIELLRPEPPAIVITKENAAGAVYGF